MISNHNSGPEWRELFPPTPTELTENPVREKHTLHFWQVERDRLRKQFEPCPSIFKPPPGTPEPSEEEREREFLRQERVLLENDLLVFRSVAEIADVQKRARRYINNRRARRISVGDGEDELVK